MNQITKRKRYQRLVSSILCLVLLVGLIGFGDIPTAKAVKGGDASGKNSKHEGMMTKSPSQCFMINRSPR